MLPVLRASQINSPHFRRSIYADLNIEETLRFFTRRYVEPLKRFVDISSATAVDCAAGYGWFSFAYLLAGGKEAIAVDMDAERLDAAREIAERLGVEHRMRFICSSIQDIPLAENGADIFVSIETLEHVGRRNILPALKRIKDIASQAVVLTTPNRLFPVVAHDTQLPFIHWLPANHRRWLAEKFSRGAMDHRNDFLTPFDLDMLCAKFKPATRCGTFPNFVDYAKSFPCYLPYGANAERYTWGPGGAQKAYYRAAAAVLGRHSYWVLPTLARIFVRHNPAAA